MRRMTAVRGFARHMSGIDPATQVPPLGLVTFRQHRRPPFLYSSTDIELLMAEVPRLVPTTLRAATLQTMIGLLAATGMRVGEVIALHRSDIDLSQGVLIVRDSKFGKSREVPALQSTMDALASYSEVHRQYVLQPTITFFSSSKATPVIYTDFATTFRQLVNRCGIGANAAVPPRIHDLRHSFAVSTLLRWYQAGQDVGTLLPRLSTYLGHVTPVYTYWYLSASPELMASAVARLEDTDGRPR